MPHFANWIAFALIVLGMVLTPGPNMIYLVSRSICQGPAAGLVSLGGVALGFVFYMLSAAFGVTALVITASGFFTEVEDALNVIWQAPRHESYLYQLVRGRILSLMLVVVLGVLLLFSMLIATAARLLAGLVRGYQLAISPLLRPSCRFTPSCSEYAHESLVEHGALRGTWLAVRRLLRCHPFCAGGYDPVPPSKRRMRRAGADGPAAPAAPEPALVPAMPSKEAGEFSC